MTKPLIQIDDLVREMTDEEYAVYLADQESRTSTKDEIAPL